ncbi:hypothetical protein B0J13DRAFT_611936 [Dactylonectria estremocensis]|uniref:Uncharacterized protein n=1 Tax=Dactylonectria estremocensis TaxID=1079267 RepID=A0A9P9DQM1_9HYPO|nr:hypothetical protein B0J13DRAFT_611936 [Dactylonectria estremocensis]
MFKAKQRRSKSIEDQVSAAASGAYHLDLTIDPADVRLIPSEEDPYRWKWSSEKEYLFEKHLSKLSVGPLMELCKGVGTSFQAVRPSVEVGKKPWNETQDLRDEISKLKEERSEIMQLAKKERSETMLAKRHSGKYKREYCELRRRYHKQQQLLARYKGLMTDLLRDSESIESPSLPRRYDKY